MIDSLGEGTRIEFGSSFIGKYFESAVRLRLNRATDLRRSEIDLERTMQKFREEIKYTFDPTVDCHADGNDFPLPIYLHRPDIGIMNGYMKFEWLLL
jgi:hypothetical protein